MSDRFYRSLARRAADRYARASRYARGYAFGKLTRDPVFRHIVERGLLPRDACLVDLGCGQGVLEALLAASQENAGEWPREWAPPPQVRAMLGIDLAERDLARARSASGARFVRGDIRTAEFGRADAVVALDVLHYIGRDDQERVLARARRALPDGGLLLLRVADADGSWRFRVTLAADRLAMALRGHPAAPFHCRPAAEWRRTLEALGFRVEATPMSAGTPFANVLLAARYDPSRTSER